jgi:hypothetical protein
VRRRAQPQASINWSAIRARRIGELGKASVTLTPAPAHRGDVRGAQRCNQPGHPDSNAGRYIFTASSRVSCSRRKSNRAPAAAELRPACLYVTDGKPIPALGGREELAQAWSISCPPQSTAARRLQNLQHSLFALPPGWFQVKRITALTLASERTLASNSTHRRSAARPDAARSARVFLPASRPTCRSPTRRGRGGVSGPAGDCAPDLSHLLQRRHLIYQLQQALLRRRARGKFKLLHHLGRQARSERRSKTN